MKHTELSKQSHRITHLSALTNYTYIHFVDSPKVLISRSISFCVDQLSDFLRIHKKCLVNPKYVYWVRISDSGLMEIQVGQEWLPVSRRRKNETIQQLQAYYQPRLIPGLPPARSFRTNSEVNSTKAPSTDLTD